MHQEDEFDYCAMVRGIADDPHAQVYNLTVGKMLALRQHIYTCIECSDIVDELHERYPESQDFYQSPLN